jgi:hypothetical protein
MSDGFHLPGYDLGQQQPPRRKKTSSLQDDSLHNSNNLNSPTNIRSPLSSNGEVNGTKITIEAAALTIFGSSANNFSNNNHLDDSLDADFSSERKEFASEDGIPPPPPIDSTTVSASVSDYDSDEDETAAINKFRAAASAANPATGSTSANVDVLVRTIGGIGGLAVESVPPTPPPEDDEGFYSAAITDNDSDNELEGLERGGISNLATIGIPEVNTNSASPVTLPSPQEEKEIQQQPLVTEPEQDSLILPIKKHIPPASPGVKQVVAIHVRKSSVPTVISDTPNNSDANDSNNNHSNNDNNHGNPDYNNNSSSENGPGGEAAARNIESPTKFEEQPVAAAETKPPTTIVTNNLGPNLTIETVDSPLSSSSATTSSSTTPSHAVASAVGPTIPSFPINQQSNSLNPTASTTKSHTQTWPAVYLILKDLIKSSAKPSAKLQAALNYAESQLQAQEIQQNAHPDAKKLNAMQNNAQKAAEKLKITGPITPAILLESLTGDFTSPVKPKTVQPSHSHNISISSNSGSTNSVNSANSALSANPTSGAVDASLAGASAPTKTLSNGKTIPLDLLGMLRSNVGYRYMLIHLYREYSEENLLVLKAIENYRTKPSIQQLKLIFTKYLSDSAELQINISSRSRVNVAKLIESIDMGAPVIVFPSTGYYHLTDVQTASPLNFIHNPTDPNSVIILQTALDPIFKEIVRLLERDSFSRFKQTSLWQEYLEGKIPPDVLKRAGDRNLEVFETELSSPNNAAAGSGRGSTISKPGAMRGQKRMSIVRIKNDVRPTEFNALLASYTGFRFLLSYAFKINEEANLVCSRAIEVFFSFPSVKTLKKFSKNYLEQGACELISLPNNQQIVTKCKELIAKSLEKSGDQYSGELNKLLQQLYKELRAFIEEKTFKNYKQHKMYKDYMQGEDAQVFDQLINSNLIKDKDLHKAKLKVIDEILAASMVMGNDETHEVHNNLIGSPSNLLSNAVAATPELTKASQPTNPNQNAQLLALASSPLTSPHSQPQSSTDSKQISADSAPQAAQSATPGHIGPVYGPDGRVIPESRTRGNRSQLGILCISSWYSAGSGILNVYIHSAHHLPEKDSTGASDPTWFIKIYVLPDYNKKSKQKTKRIRGKFIQFNQHFKFELPTAEFQGKRVEMSLWSYHIGAANDYCGQINIPVANISRNKQDPETSYWYCFEPINWVSRKEKPI